MRTVNANFEEIGGPTDLAEGEMVRVVRLGGPRDGDFVSYAVVELPDENGVILRPAKQANETSPPW